MKYFSAAVVFGCGEFLALVIFWILRKYLGTSSGNNVNKLACVKGTLERITVVTGLLSGFPQVIIAFGALKIGTRLKEDVDGHISNTYFLIGNLISILLAMLDAVVIKSIIWCR